VRERETIILGFINGNRLWKKMEGGLLRDYIWEEGLSSTRLLSPSKRSSFDRLTIKKRLLQHSI
jgi:hypothetical protein